MGVLTTAGKNLVLDSGIPATLYAALHSGAPGADGSAAELSGGSPAYARLAVSMAAASGGSRAMSAQYLRLPAGTGPTPACGRRSPAARAWPRMT